MSVRFHFAHRWSLTLVGLLAGGLASGVSFAAEPTKKVEKSATRPTTKSTHTESGAKKDKHVGPKQGAKGDREKNGAAKGAEPKRPTPNADLTPGQVVRIVMDALKRNDAKDAGIAVTFDFASPSNQKVTGPLERFIPLVKNPAYMPLLNHKSAKYGNTIVKDDAARQVVTVTDSNGQEAVYVFVLSKQEEGDRAACWLTDGVMRVEPGDAPADSDPLDGPDKAEPGKA